MTRTAIVLAVLIAVPAGLAGCIGNDGVTDTDDGSDAEPQGNDTSTEDGGDPRLPDGNRSGAEPPEGEEFTGLEPIEMIFDGSLRVTETRVLLVPPAHGDLGQPTNTSRSAMAYLEATLTGIFAWEPAIDQFIEQYPRFSYLDNVTVQVDLFEGADTDTTGYDFVIGYAETSGPVFRGVAIQPPGNEDQEIQRQLNEAGLGDSVHFGNRYVLLSLFASAPRAGQLVPDYPETHEIREVTMHEFAHTWGLGHSTTWTKAFGPDLMNSPYAFVYGDGDPVGDGGERSPEVCITSLNLYGLAHLYRWLPDGEWNETQEPVELPRTMDYELYCEAFEEAGQRAQAWMDAHGIEDEADVRQLAPGPAPTG